jgi:C4-dicarboxylate transporter DctQ subunit
MRWIAAVEAGAAWIGAALFTLSGFFIGYEVVSRYFFNAPTIWAAELSQLCLIWGTLLAMAWVLSARRHIRVTALTDLLTPGVRTACALFSTLVVTVFSLVVLWYGAEIFLDSFRRGRTSGTMLDIPVWIAEAAVPAGFALLAVAAARATVAILRHGPEGDRGAVE